MFYSQIIVWAVGLVIVAAAFIASGAIFHKTGLLELFHKTITTPWPLGLIIVLSAVGTYVNILFDDDVFDVATSKNKLAGLKKEKLKLYTMLGFFALTFGLYALLIHLTHTQINLQRAEDPARQPR